MNIYAVLKKDHKKLESLLDQLVATPKDEKQDWKILLQRIRDELIPHVRAEEALFYNPIRETEYGKGVVLHSYQEHAMAETELRALQAMTALDANWIALANKLRNDLLHHAEDEETKVFAAAKLVFDEEEAEDIGIAFEELKPQIKQQSFAGTSLDFILNLLPEKMRTSVRRIISKNKKHAA